MKYLTKVVHAVTVFSFFILGSTLANAAKEQEAQTKQNKTESAFSLNLNLVQQESPELTKKIQAAIMKNEAKQVAGYWRTRTRTIYVPRTRTRTVWVRRTKWVRRTRWVPRTRTTTRYVPRRVTRTIYVRTRARRRVRVRYVPVRYAPRARTRTIFYSVCPE